MSGTPPNMDDWWAQYQRKQEEREKRAQAMARYAAGALRFAGVQKVEVAFDGYGDDGEVQEPEFTPVPNGGLPEGLAELVGGCCTGLLPGGWEINAGSFGTIRLDAEKGTCKADITWREEDEEEEFDPEAE